MDEWLKSYLSEKNRITIIPSPPPPADTHLKLLDRVVSGASFLTGVVFERALAHR